MKRLVGAALVAALLRRRRDGRPQGAPLQDSPELRPGDREGARRVLEARGAPQQHAGERPLRRKAELVEPGAAAGAWRRRDRCRPARRSQRGRAPAAPARSRSSLGDQGPELRRRAAVAAEQEAAHAILPRARPGRRPARARAAAPARGCGRAEHHRVVAARDRRQVASSIGWMRTPSGSGGRSRLPARAAADEPLIAPRILEAERDVDGHAPPAWRRAPDTTPAAVRSSMQRCISRRARPWRR